MYEKYAIYFIYEHNFYCAHSLPKHSYTWTVTVKMNLLYRILNSKTAVVSKIETNDILCFEENVLSNHSQWEYYKTCKKKNALFIYQESLNSFWNIMALFWHFPCTSLNIELYLKFPNYFENCSVFMTKVLFLPFLSRKTNLWNFRQRIIIPKQIFPIWIWSKVCHCFTK